MTTIEELDRRLAVVERRMENNEAHAARSADIHSATLEAIGGLTSRVATLELIVKANALATERGFITMQGQLGELRTEMITLRRDLPGIIGDALRAQRLGGDD